MRQGLPDSAESCEVDGALGAGALAQAPAVRPPDLALLLALGQGPS